MQKTVNNPPRGLFFIISAPAGTGKTTLVDMLLKEFPSIVRSVSYTTRKKREGEEEGEDYHFISATEFKEKIDEGFFLEYANVFGDYYGTSKDFVFQKQKEGKHVIFVIDTQGAMQLKKLIPSILIFIKPPSEDVLRQRLEKRRTETPESLERRLSKAKEEMQTSRHYDYILVNDDLSHAYEALKAVILSEEFRNRKEK